MKALIASFLFIFLYGSGFVATQYGLPYVDPVSFLVIRFAITACLMGTLCLVIRPKLAGSKLTTSKSAGSQDTAGSDTIKDLMHTFIAGALMVGLFSLGVFLAIDYGLSASTTALVISFQPLVASVMAQIFFKAKVSIAQWIGLIIGLIGVLFIVFWGLKTPNIIGLLLAGLGLLGVACGSVYQKHFCADMHLVFGGFIQSCAACILCALVWPLYGAHFIEWTPEFIFSLLWMAIAVSIGGVNMLYILIRQLSISKVSTLFYLIPIAALVLSLIFLEGHIYKVQGIGIILISLSIYLVARYDQRSIQAAIETEKAKQIV
ncbi:DMT family transporter [Psychrobacter sp. FDAARGOS_221]|uniref:DMT family transporter n=1 Tax=Psychrobacter sp. FDAARGOS_221 TaxID=1975705 RepID=UPI000BB53571|nr:DMT family transporter [Psychrobacter sp. FDAARGOS_221]PNK60449.1 EamA/RhaT family transporter [Psychrobacter sp. FDAARGOS_221]